MEILPRCLCWWHVLCHCIALIHILKLYLGMQARPMNLLWIVYMWRASGSANYRATVSCWHLLWYWKGYQPVQPINNMVMTSEPWVGHVVAQRYQALMNRAILLLGHYIYGAGMWLILRQCAPRGKSHTGPGTSCGVLGPPAGAATVAGICWDYGGVLHCIWTPFGPLHPNCDLLSESGCHGGVCCF